MTLAKSLDRGAPWPATDYSNVSALYIHIPFCEHRCDYCAFATWTNKAHLTSSYVSACKREIENAVKHGMGPLQTVFVGGGTPSLLEAKEFERLLDGVPRRDDCEVSVEANPSTTSEAKISAWKRAGVTRVSLGVQSPNERVLGSLGRRQSAKDVDMAVDLVGSAGFNSWSLDVIFGAAAESDSDWQSTLNRVIQWNAPHISAYALTVEPGTILADQQWRHPDEDVQARRYEIADEMLSAAGMQWYEISNWAHLGHESRHNQHYWHGSAYLGIGCAAHSYSNGRRWWNIRTPQRYIDHIKAALSPVACEEVLDPAAQRFEKLMLAIRTRRGFPLDELQEIPDELAGLVFEDNGRLILTLRGRLLANEVALRLQKVLRAEPATPFGEKSSLNL